MESDECERCNATMSIAVGSSPSRICDHCAQELAAPVWEEIKDGLPHRIWKALKKRLAADQ